MLPYSPYRKDSRPATSPEVGKPPAKGPAPLCRSRLTDAELAADRTVDVLLGVDVHVVGGWIGADRLQRLGRDAGHAALRGVLRAQRDDRRAELPLLAL